MRGRELVLAATLLACAPACISNPDPRPRSLAQVQSDAHGGYAVVGVFGQGEHAGELIAIDPGGVWVLFAGQLIHTPLAQVSSLEVYPYDVSVAGVAGWGVAGTLSTISHGFFLVLTAPTWIVTSTVVGAVHSRTAREQYDGTNWPALAKWARFPQGMPPGLAATDLLYGRPAGVTPLPSGVPPPGPPGPLLPPGMTSPTLPPVTPPSTPITPAPSPTTPAPPPPVTASPPATTPSDRP